MAEEDKGKTRTKAQLEAEIEELQGKLEKANEEAARAQAAAAAASVLAGDNGGWLIEAPNPKYNGVTLGVYFSHGRGFVPKSEAGERLVDELIREWRYKAEFKTPAEVAELRSHGQRDVVEEQTDRKMLETLANPSVLGG
jgi:CO dehydrogenase/acetyl-CoA synthase delta subunit